MRRKNGFLDETCSYNERIAECNNTRSESSIRMSTYYGKVICKSPLPSNMSLLQMNTVLSHGECPEGERVCGDTHSHDGKHYQKCIPYKMGCPIVGLEIVEKTPEMDLQTHVLNESTALWQYLDYSDTLALRVSTSLPRSEPLISGVVMEGNPCLVFQNEEQIIQSDLVASNSRPSFILEKVEYVEECQRVDNRYHAIKAPPISEKQFYEENGVAQILFADKYTNGQYYTTENNDTKTIGPIQTVQEVNYKF